MPLSTFVKFIKILNIPVLCSSCIKISNPGIEEPNIINRFYQKPFIGSTVMGSLSGFLIKSNVQVAMLDTHC